MEIRRATLQDIDSIMSELSTHIAACKVHYPEPDKSSVAQTILSSFHHTAPMVVFVAQHSGALIGLACAVVSRYLWSQKMQCEIRLVYVSPEHRGGTAFSRLMQAVELWSQDKGADEMSFTLSTGVGDENTAEILQKRGWNRVGIDLVKSL